MVDSLSMCLYFGCIVPFGSRQVGREPTSLDAMFESTKDDARCQEFTCKIKAR